MAMINQPQSSQLCCFALLDREMAVRTDGAPLSFADLKKIQSACGQTDLFEEPDNGICVLGIEQKDLLPTDYQMIPIRSWIYGHSESETNKVSRAKALLSWRKATQYCACCGEKLKPHPALTAFVCPDCGQLFFPRIEPCIIVLVQKDDKILLANHAQRNQDIYACLAGFIEAGETVEQAVQREIMEETGLSVKNIRYFGSQSWPFPTQLMLGFEAEWESGEITLQPEEISDAAWFDPFDCPATPQPGSIAYRLIEAARSRISSHKD